MYFLLHYDFYVSPNHTKLQCLHVYFAEFIFFVKETTVILAAFIFIKLEV